MLRKRNSFPAAEIDVDVNGAKRDKREDDDDEEINVVDLSDSELDDDQKPQTSSKTTFSISNPEVLKQLSVKFRDTPCRPLDLSKKSKSNSPAIADAATNTSSSQPLENGAANKVKSWPASFMISDRQTSPFVLNQVRPSVIRSAEVCFEHQELPDVDEHFRKSLNQVPPNEAEAKVDDHFARALGKLWDEIKKQKETETNSSSESTRSSSSR